MTKNLRDLIGEEVEIEQLRDALTEPFIMDVVDYNLLSRAEAKLKWKNGETWGFYIWDENPDTICNTSHNSPVASEVYFSAMKHVITSYRELSPSEEDAYDGLRDSYLRTHERAGELLRATKERDCMGEREKEYNESTENSLINIYQNFPRLFQDLSEDSKRLVTNLRELKEKSSMQLFYNLLED